MNNIKNDIKDKIVLITGGARGIGYAIAENFLKKGAKTAIILDVQEKQGVDAVDNLNTKYGEGRAVFYKCDITMDLNIYDEIIENHKTVNILINNAGIVNDNDVKQTINTNVIALIELCNKFLSYMRTDADGQGGTIINVASISSYRITPFQPVYQASKYAVLGFTKSLGHVTNFSKTGVRILAICPGCTNTNMVSTVKPWSSFLEEEVIRFGKELIMQEADAVGKAAVDIFKRADSGTAWEVEGDAVRHVA